jgi:hypothetical protein
MLRDSDGAFCLRKLKTCLGAMLRASHDALAGLFVGTSSDPLGESISFLSFEASRECYATRESQ